jgi:hypothetical protein
MVTADVSLSLAGVAAREAVFRTAWAGLCSSLTVAVPRLVDLGGQLQEAPREPMTALGNDDLSIADLAGTPRADS